MKNFKFELGQKVFFIEETKLIEAVITKRVYEQTQDLGSDTIKEKNEYVVEWNNGKELKYKAEINLFETKEDFIKQL